jgi:hypothetical protein
LPQAKHEPPQTNHLPAAVRNRGRQTQKFADFAATGFWGLNSAETRENSGLLVLKWY